MTAVAVPAVDLPVDLVPVKSSNIAAIGYDADKSEMYVKFKDFEQKGGKIRVGSTHIYSGVTPEVYVAFVSAESIGKHFHTHIRDKFDGVKLEAPASDTATDAVKESAHV